jgi:hypothetical protein
MSARTQASAGSSATRSTATEPSGTPQNAASRLEELAAAHGPLASSGRHLPAFGLTIFFYPYYPLYAPYPYYADPYCDPFIRPRGPQQLLLLHELPAVLDQAPRISDRGIAGAASIPPRSV